MIQVSQREAVLACDHSPVQVTILTGRVEDITLPNKMVAWLQTRGTECVWFRRDLLGSSSLFTIQSDCLALFFVLFGIGGL